MNQITLDVRLFAKSTEDDILAFMFDDGEYQVNLNMDTCQGELKSVFSKLIQISIDNNVILNLIIEDDYGRGLYKDVCKEYIYDLQRELDNIKEKIRKEMFEE